MTTSNTGSQLLAEIAANPDEDTPRLMYADWLDEHAGTVPCRKCNGTKIYKWEDETDWGTPIPRKDPCWHCQQTGEAPDDSRDRAEFIRVQHRLTRPFRTCSPVCSQECGHAKDCKLELKFALIQRERQLLDAHPEWSRCRCPRMADRQWGPSDPRGCSPTCPTCGGTGDLFVSPGVSGASKPRTVTFARGFPDSVTCTLAEAFGTDGTPTSWAVAVVRQTPVTRFVVTDRRPEQDRGDQRPVWFNRGQVSNQTVMESTIPEFVYEEMRGYDNVPCPPHIGKWYPTAESAVTALAIAAGRVVRRAVYGKDGAA